MTGPHTEQVKAARLAVEAVLRECADAAYWLSEHWTAVSYAHSEHEAPPSREKLRMSEKRYNDAAKLLAEAELHAQQVQRHDRAS